MQKTRKKPTKKLAKRRPLKAKPARKLVAGKEKDRRRVKLRAGKRKSRFSGKWIRKRPQFKSLDEAIKWRPWSGDHLHDKYTFDPVQIPLRLLPRDIREHYTFKEVDLAEAYAFPGKPVMKPKPDKAYFVVTRKDGMKDAWAKLANPSLRGMPKYWQIDKKIKWYKPWQW